ncbi:hypothetical protein ACE3MS_08080 [Paenibacillus dendritiformis]|uniref:hypothetical protein n=1 Tax=Paenibacillus dendritiformis TaxID=130049 RepID=UPI0036503CAB
MKENKKLRFLLILQSFMPLMVLLFLKNFDNDLIFLVRKFFIQIWNHEFTAITVAVTHKKFLLLIVIIICILWIIVGLYSMLLFKGAQFANFIDDKIKIISYSSDAGLIFFTTFIVPLVLDDIGSMRNFLVFICLFLMIIVLMYKTNLYYQNPVIAMLGYSTFHFKFTENSDSTMKNNELVGITYGKIDEDKIIKYQRIADNVYFIYNKNL